MKSQKVIRFIATGGLAAGTEYAIFIGLSFMLGQGAFSLIEAQVVSFTAGLFVSFFLNKHWSFQSKGSAKTEFFRYLTLAMINLCLSTAILWALVNFAGVHPLISKVITMGLIATWNFFLFEKFIFSSHQERDE